ncbi:prolipoprotein diacylglyceryl transferase [Natronolimnobius baerhuensis]|uniref:Uncharacterized protein n=1 Tax=Natronolimnobius baerhuensis TaxID=253108 RepID=A0A202E3S3_9EURY|nr:hypothetical protein [Natronolimnobius baerhuensis]OVE82838.1 hypothetical protein B2G88_18785 [Natronolimnobius baerhuensis]
MSNPFDDLKAGDENDADEIEGKTDSSAPTGTETPASEPVADSSTSTEPESTDDVSPPVESSSESPAMHHAEPESRAEASEETAPVTDAEAVTGETETDTTNDDEPDAAETGPAFEYSEVRQKPLYARDSTWNELEDELGITVTPELRRMGIRDEETREIHDAILKVAIEHIDELPDAIADVRRQSM